MEKLFARFASALAGQPTDEQLSAFCDEHNWVLRCAHDAPKTMGWELWWLCSGDNWLTEARATFPRLTSARYERFLRAYADATKDLDALELYEEIAARRGWQRPIRHAGGSISPPGPGRTEEKMRANCCEACCRKFNRSISRHCGGLAQVGRVRSRR